MTEEKNIPELISIRKPDFMKILRDIPLSRIHIFHDKKNPSNFLLVVGSERWKEFKKAKKEEEGDIR